MYVHFRRTRIEIWTPAKLNLYLEVLGQRADGYHDVETLMVPISLYDTLQLSPRRDGRITLSAGSARGAVTAGPNGATDLGHLPPPSENIVVRPLQLLQQRAGISSGLDVQLVKRIPAAAGLGGGSSDAAAALSGAHFLWQLDWPVAELAELGAEVGSDVPFFFAGSAAWCRGRGERVEPMDFGVRPHFVILRPPHGLSTAAVYAQVDEAGKRNGGRRWSPTGNGRLHEVAGGLFNRLQTAAEQLAPWLRQVRREFDRLDVLGHQLSGSGSAYFGVCRNARHACRMAAVLRSRCRGSVFSAVMAIGGQRRVLPVSPN